MRQVLCVLRDARLVHVEKQPIEPQPRISLLARREVLKDREKLTDLACDNFNLALLFVPIVEVNSIILGS